MAKKGRAQTPTISRDRESSVRHERLTQMSFLYISCILRED